MGTSLTASISPDAHLLWIESQLMQIGRALGRTPLPSHIKQRFLLYGAHSKISHTHCLMSLSPQAIREMDSVLEGIYRQILNLPPTFTKVGLHVLLNDLGLNSPSLWEDYCGAAIRSWTQILNDEGALGTTARASLQLASAKFRHWPLEMAFHSRRGCLPLCSYIVACNMATLLMADLHPIGGPEI